VAAALAQKASYARRAQVQAEHSTPNHDVPPTHSPATSHSASAATQRTISPAILHRRKRLGISSRISLTATTEPPTLTGHTLPPPNDSRTEGSSDANSIVDAISSLEDEKLTDMLAAAFTRAFPGFSHPMPVKEATVKLLDSPARRARRQRETQIKELRNSTYHKQYLVSQLVASSYSLS
jgi:hypothetical protein